MSGAREFKPGDRVLVEGVVYAWSPKTTLVQFDPGTMLPFPTEALRRTFPGEPERVRIDGEYGFWNEVYRVGEMIVVRREDYACVPTHRAPVEEKGFSPSPHLSPSDVSGDAVLRRELEAAFRYGTPVVVRHLPGQWLVMSTAAPPWIEVERVYDHARVQVRFEDLTPLPASGRPR